jgi:hypothetical protein
VLIFSKPKSAPSRLYCQQSASIFIIAFVPTASVPPLVVANSPSHPKSPSANATTLFVPEDMERKTLVHVQLNDALATIKEEATQRFVSNLKAVLMMLLKKLFMISLSLLWGKTHYTHGITKRHTVCRNINRSNVR